MNFQIHPPVIPEAKTHGEEKKNILHATHHIPFHGIIASDIFFQGLHQREKVMSERWPASNGQRCGTE